ncbi:hypothetical protein K9B33_01130 [Sphingobium sp. 3R8]|nr:MULTISPECIES: hypothetical protein [Sphingomonadaceae]MBZ9646138.1 hypothetical protein [Sphingobium sp. 3R8]
MLWAPVPMALAVATGLMAAHPATAQPAIRLGTQMFVERVSTDINGRPRRTLESADRVGPGDTLIVIVHWRNDGAQPVRDYAVTRAVPHGTRPDISDPHMQVSVDGGGHWGRLDQLWLPTPLGGVRRAVAEDVTHIRWQLPEAVPPGRAGRLSYRAVMR